MQKTGTHIGLNIGQCWMPIERAVDRGRIDRLVRDLFDPDHPVEILEDFKAWAVEMDKIKIEEAIAEGIFGILYRGTYNGQHVTIKLLDRQFGNVWDDKERQKDKQFLSEVRVLAELTHHPNIVRFIGACQNQNVNCIITEYLVRGSVRKLLSQQPKGVSVQVAIRQALDIARGMACIHGLGLIHKDLKSDNLLVADDMSVKIAGFGVAKIFYMHDGMTPGTESYRWRAP